MQCLAGTKGEPGTGVVPAPKGCGKIQLLTGVSFRDGGEGGDEVSNTRSWPPPCRNRRAVTTSGFSVPACANDVLDAGLALSLSPGHVLCSPHSFQHRYWAARRQGTLDLGQCCSGLTSPTSAGCWSCVCCHQRKRAALTRVEGWSHLDWGGLPLAGTHCRGSRALWGCEGRAIHSCVWAWHTSSGRQESWECVGREIVGWDNIAAFFL